MDGTKIATERLPPQINRILPNVHQKVNWGKTFRRQMGMGKCSINKQWYSGGGMNPFNRCRWRNLRWGRLMRVKEDGQAPAQLRPRSTISRIHSAIKTTSDRATEQNTNRSFAFRVNGRLAQPLTWIFQFCYCTLRLLGMILMHRVGILQIAEGVNENTYVCQWVSGTNSGMMSR